MSNRRNETKKITMNVITKLKKGFISLFGLFILISSCHSQKEEVAFRDLNKNGTMDVYEDSSQLIDLRVDDLLSQMTLEEKAGMMFINGARINEDGSIEINPSEGRAFGQQALHYIKNNQMNHFNIWGIPSVEALANWYNNLQQYMVDSTRLGIPFSLASDPRNSFSESIFSMEAKGFSQWPEQLGFAAIGDPELMRQHADMARQEYVALGIRIALHPVADLATEPRWPRISGTFGEDAQLSAKMLKPYILGFQGNALGKTSVACMTKHFSGGGPQKEGLDPHFEFQQGQVYPGDNFEYHIKPFEAAFEANTASIMPYYGVPTDQTSENVAFGFNKDVITGLLREKYQYDGVVCTDWGLITDTHMGPVLWPARAWGVEDLSEEERVLKALDAGVDQFGGENCTQHVISLVKGGKLTESRIDESIRRLLKQKFELGLFDDPFIDVQNAMETVGKDEFVQAGNAAQRRSFTLLKNPENFLPLKDDQLKIYAEGIDSAIVAKYASFVGSPAEADLAILRLSTPWVPVETDNFFARGFHHGDLDFKNGKKDSIMMVLDEVPTIVDIYLDRPAVIPDIADKSAALIANYGASDEALLDVLFGKAKPEGKLPFELPSSMEAVKNQKEDVPYDSEDPLFSFGFGLSYE